MRHPIAVLVLLAPLALAACGPKTPKPAADTGAPAAAADGPTTSGGPGSSGMVSSPVERLNALLARRDQLTRRDGQVTMGEADVAFAAWYERDSVVLVEVNDDLAEHGRMKTDYGYENGRLFRVVADGELRRNEPGRPEFLDPIHYELNFGESSGSGSGTWGPDMLTDIPQRAESAAQSAELLRRAAQGLAGH